MPPNAHPSPAEVAIRPATFADIDDIVAVFEASAPLEKAFHWKYPQAQQYPEDLTKHEKLVHHLMVSPEYSDYHVMVAEAPSLQDVTVSKIIAYAVWYVSYHNKSHSSQQPQNPKTDAIAQLGGVSACRHINPGRHTTLSQVEGYGFDSLNSYYDDLYGVDNHLELVRVKTHPDYMRRGFGSALVNWGIDLAKEQHLATVTVWGTDMGMLLFAHLGFKLKDTLRLRGALGDPEILILDWYVLMLQAYHTPEPGNLSSHVYGRRTRVTQDGYM